MAAQTALPLRAAQAKHAKTKNATKPDTSEEEQRLRIQLQFAPHDRAAYEQLHKLLSNRYAFRAQTQLAAQWLQGNPDDYPALVDLTSAATAALNDPELAIAAQRAYLKNVQRNPEDTTYDFVMSSLASELTKRGRAEEALRLSDQLLEWTPDDAGLWADRAAIQYRLGRANDAIASLRNSLKLDSGDENVHEKLGDLLFLGGKVDDAVSEYRAAISAYAAKYKTGEASDSSSGLLGSLIKVEQKFQGEHSLAQMHLKLARALIQVGKPDEAIPETHDALAVDKNAFAALYLRARAYEAAGDTANAQKTRAAVLTAITSGVSKEEIKRSKEFGDPRVAILLRGENTSEFAPLDFASELIGLLDNRTEPLTSLEKLALAQALVDAGATEKGRLLWESVLAEKSFASAQAHSAIARALLQAGDREHALPHLRRSYELDPLNTTYRIDYDAERGQQ
jgi:tetratricopeptide (TPR) repeat protein